MREALFVLIVIAALLGLTAFRYRKQIAAGLQVWRMMKEMRTKVGSMQNERGEPELKAAGPLVNCSKCGTWVPESRSLQVGKMHFCSKDCLERTAA